MEYWEKYSFPEPSTDSSAASQNTPILSFYLAYLSSREPIQAMESPFVPNAKLECINVKQKDRPPLKIYSQRQGKDIPLLVHSDTLSLLPRRLAIAKEITKNMATPVIHYERLSPESLPCVNALLCQFFWPGIDGSFDMCVIPVVKDVLFAPEYSVVAKYKHLVVGAGFVSSTGYLSHLIVHPDWQKCGIGKTILYMLIKECPSIDITLHVSVNNPALLLYNQFGFKGESFLVNFYDKYLPPDSQLSKHALFLRLRQ